jgi:hypothetical protein
MTKITAVLFIVIFVLNLLPAFAPPTWTAMSFIGLTIPSIDFVSLAVVAANCGHLRAHYLGKVVARDRAAEIAEQTRHNVDATRQGIEGRPVMTSSTFLAYSFSPLSSNYLFIAYGLPQSGRRGEGRIRVRSSLGSFPSSR